jgi:hypothetical protein
MFVPFLIFAVGIGTFAAHNEGVIKVGEEYGQKAAIKLVVENRKPVDYSKMND